MAKQYIADREIKSIEGAVVEFTSGVKEEFSDKALGYLVKDKPLEPTEYQELVTYHVHLEILEVFRSNNLKQSDVQPVIQRTLETWTRTIDENLGKILGLDKRVKFSEQYLENIKLTDLGFKQADLK